MGAAAGALPGERAPGTNLCAFCTSLWLLPAPLETQGQGDGAWLLPSKAEKLWRFQSPPNHSLG